MSAMAVLIQQDGWLAPYPNGPHKEDASVSQLIQHSNVASCDNQSEVEG